MTARLHEAVYASMTCACGELLESVSTGAPETCPLCLRSWSLYAELREPGDASGGAEAVDALGLEVGATPPKRARRRVVGAGRAGEAPR